MTWHCDAFPLLLQLSLLLLLLLLLGLLLFALLNLGKIRWRYRRWCLTRCSRVRSWWKSSTGSGQIMRPVRWWRLRTQRTWWCSRTSCRRIVEPGIQRVRVRVRYASTSNVHLRHLR